MTRHFQDLGRRHRSRHLKGQKSVFEVYSAKIKENIIRGLTFFFETVKYSTTEWPS